MMKKSILATLLAGLVSFGSVAGDEPHMMKLEIEKQDHGPMVVKVAENGSDYEFSFSEEELKDKALLASQLQVLDEKTRAAVLKALTAGLQGGNMIFIDEDEVHGSDGEHKIVVVKEFKYDDQNSEDGHQVVIRVDGDSDAQVAHKIIESVDGRSFAFRVGPDGDKVKWHHDGKSNHMGKVIENLLQNAQLSAEQVEKLQQLLDEKRK